MTVRTLRYGGDSMWRTLLLFALVVAVIATGLVAGCTSPKPRVGIDRDSYGNARIHIAEGECVEHPELCEWW